MVTLKLQLYSCSLKLDYWCAPNNYCYTNNNNNNDDDDDDDDDLYIR